MNLSIPNWVLVKNPTLSNPLPTCYERVMGLSPILISPMNPGKIPVLKTEQKEGFMVINKKKKPGGPKEKLINQRGNLHIYFDGEKFILRNVLTKKTQFFSNPLDVLTILDRFAPIED